MKGMIMKMIKLCGLSVLPVAHRGKLPVVAELAVDVVILPWGKPTHHNSPFPLAGLLFSLLSICSTISM